MTSVFLINFSLNLFLFSFFSEFLMRISLVIILIKLDLLKTYPGVLIDLFYNKKSKIYTDFNTKSRSLFIFKVWHVLNIFLFFVALLLFFY